MFDMLRLSKQTYLEHAILFSPAKNNIVYLNNTTTDYLVVQWMRSLLSSIFLQFYFCLFTSITLLYATSVKIAFHEVKYVSYFTSAIKLLYSILHSISGIKNTYVYCDIEIEMHYKWFKKTNIFCILNDSLNTKCKYFHSSVCCSRRQLNP